MKMTTIVLLTIGLLAVSANASSFEPVAIERSNFTVPVDGNMPVTDSNMTSPFFEGFETGAAGWSFYDGNGETVGWQVIEDPDLAWADACYLGLENVEGGTVLYAESPAFDTPTLAAEETMFLDVYFANVWMNTDNLTESFWWRPEIYDPNTDTWGPLASLHNAVYVESNGGVWESFSTSGYAYDWNMEDYQGLDGVKVRFVFNVPADITGFDFMRLDNVEVFHRSIEHDVSPVLKIPYPTVVDYPVFGEVRLSNNTMYPADNVSAAWTLNGQTCNLLPMSPYNMDPYQTSLLFISDPVDPDNVDFWLPTVDDIGVNHLSATSSYADDENPTNDIYPMIVNVMPSGHFEVGADSRGFTSNLSIPSLNDGPVVHLDAEEINPDYFFDQYYDLSELRMWTYFHQAAGGAPANASMTFHVYQGGNTPGDELFSVDYDFDVDEGYVGDYNVVVDIEGEPGTRWLSGDVWVWAEITSEGLNGYPQPFIYQTIPNHLQHNHFDSFADAQAGNNVSDYGYHVTMTMKHLGTEPPVSMSMTPIHTDVPGNGGSIFYQLEIISQVDYPLDDICYWVDIVAPEGVELREYKTAFFNAFPHRHMFIQSIQNAVPGWAPDGVYEFHGYIGYPPMYYDSDVFIFVKGGANDGPTVQNWAHDDLDFGGEEEVMAVTSDLPTEYALSQAYPNPFNPTTSLDIYLPQAGDLNVSVYNVNGQQVDVVTSGMYQAGRHTLTINGSQLASGVYFVRATVPGKMTEMRKLVLMK
ncbi:T9SS type A sorting domain-containing protein [bacterium]|nr:T9SS type A sorting domain-containing protein [bacterium]